MKKSKLLSIPTIVSFVFIYSCGTNPFIDQPTAYNFTFVGMNCNIEHQSSYETKIYEGDKNVTFIINSEYDFVLTQSDININGNNTTYNEGTHELVISEVTGNVAIAANATKKPTFTFRGDNCNINGDQDITDLPLKKGDENVEFKINVDAGCILEGKDLKILGENVKYDSYRNKITITEVVGPIIVQASAYANKTFNFTGTNCRINGSSKISGEPLKLGEKDVKFTIGVDNAYFLNDADVQVIRGTGVTYDKDTRTLTISEVTDNVEVIAEAKPLEKRKINVHLTNCHLSEDLKDDGYVVGSKVQLKFLGDVNHDIGVTTPYEIPKSITVESLSPEAYKYDPATGILIINEIPSGSNPINISATSEPLLHYVVLNEFYRIVLDEDQNMRCQDAYQIWDELSYNGELGLPPIVTSKESETPDPYHPHELIMDNNHPKSKELTDRIPPDAKFRGYAIKVEDDGDIIIGYQSKLARTCAIDRILTDFAQFYGIYIPVGLDIKASCPDPDTFITTIDLPEDRPGVYREIRDPFIYRDGTDYYMYGTTDWDGVEWRVYSAKDSFTNDWQLVNHSIVDETQYPDIKMNRWAPEMHRFNNKYYMFTTYLSKVKNRHGRDIRGVTIFQSDSLTDDFVMISRHGDNKVQPGHITSDDVYESTIDGSLYVTQDGIPWMVYVDEWVDNDCGYGFMDIVPLTFQDQSVTIDQNRNVALFDAHAAQWSTDKITDGCFIHRANEGDLVMLWSNNDRSGNYAIGLVCNHDGEAQLANPESWKQQRRTLYTEGIYDGAPNGGHGMIFDGPDGQLYLCLHVRNNGPDTCANIIPVKEAYGTIVWDLYNHAS